MLKSKKLIKGKNIRLRDIELDDASFILQLRLDEDKNRYLHKTSPILANQINYINSYKQKDNEYYFIIESLNTEKLGTVRIYDVTEDSFCWGSWLVINDAPRTAALESALLIYEFAFYNLGFVKTHFDVRKNNERVIAFHTRMGSKIVSEDELNYYFNFTKEDYEIIRLKYEKFLPIQNE